MKLNTKHIVKISNNIIDIICMSLRKYVRLQSTRAGGYVATQYLGDLNILGLITLVSCFPLHLSPIHSSSENEILAPTIKFETTTIANTTPPQIICSN